MLIPRIITAIVLLLMMLSALFYFSPLLWNIFSALMVGIALWEFCNMARMQPAAKWSYLVLSALMAAAAVYWRYSPAIIEQCIVLVFWLIIVPVWLVKRWALKESLWTRFVGWMIVFPAWFALMQWRPSPNAATGMLAIMGIVWVADIAAYIAGKTFGKHKLAPGISPGKTWEGVAGGVIGCVAYALLVDYLNWWPVALSTKWLVILAVVFGVISVLGDLLESWFKRGAGMKDSSHLLPGHGGVYDRIDGLVAVLAVSSAVYTVVLY